MSASPNVETPNFVGRRALVLHRPEAGIERLVRQLHLIGLGVEQRWSPLAAGEPFDLVLVDADQGWDGLLPWPAAEAAMAVVALLGSEAPGRIAWAIGQGAGAIIAKPVVASAVYPALVLAGHVFTERAAARERIALMGERLRLRPLVHRAVAAVMVAQGVDEEDAYGRLRRAAMERRLSLEQMAAALLSGLDRLSETA